LAPNGQNTHFADPESVADLFVEKAGDNPRSLSIFGQPYEVAVYTALSSHIIEVFGDEFRRRLA